MSELKFTVRNVKGEIVKQQKENNNVMDNEKLSWEGANRVTVYNAIKTLPKYNRGKLSHDLMYREIPQKEMRYSYSNDGIELVMSEKKYAEVKASKSYMYYHYEDMTSADCRVIDKSLPYLIIMTDYDKLTTPALFKYCERNLCQYLKHFSNMNDLKQAAELYDWLDTFLNCTSFITRIEDGSCERKLLYIRPNGCEEKYLSELDWKQKQMLKTGTKHNMLSCSIKKTIENNSKIQSEIIGAEIRN